MGYLTALELFILFDATLRIHQAEQPAATDGDCLMDVRLQGEGEVVVGVPGWHPDNNIIVKVRGYEMYNYNLWIFTPTCDMLKCTNLHSSYHPLLSYYYPFRLPATRVTWACHPRGPLEDGITPSCRLHPTLPSPLPPWPITNASSSSLCVEL